MIVSFKSISLLVLLTFILNENERIQLFHRDSDTKWIDCSVNQEGYLMDSAFVFNQHEQIIYKGYFHNGYHRDSAILYLKDSIVLKYFFKDSTTYDKSIFYNERLIRKSIVENRKGKYSIEYREDGSIDTFIVAGGEGMPKSDVRKTVDFLKRLNYGLTFD